jgi:hypothetical protein
VLVRERRFLVGGDALIADPELLGFEVVAREPRLEGRSEAELDRRVLDVFLEILDREACDKPRSYRPLGCCSWISTSTTSSG